MPIIDSFDVMILSFNNVKFVRNANIKKSLLFKSFYFSNLLVVIEILPHDVFIDVSDSLL